MPAPRARRRSARARAGALPAALGALLLLSACASEHTGANEDAARAGAPALGGEALSAAPGAPAPESVERGIEVWWWTLRADSPLLLGAPLRPHEDAPVDADPEVVALWRANGLRVLSVPVRDLPELEGTLPLVGAVRRSWLGEVTRWTSLADGPSWSEPARFRLERGALDLDAGRLRLIARAWAAPVIAGDGPARARMFVELAPEFIQPRAGTLGLSLPDLRADGALSSPTRGADAPAQGLVFERFLLRAVLEGERALVILPAPPEESWSAPPAGAPPESVVFPPLPTLGEAMLTGAGIGAEGQRRVAIVIGASVPTRFRLLPP